MVAALVLLPKGARVGSAAKGAAETYGNREAERESARESRRLSEFEVAELLWHWSGGASGAVVRSIHGAVEEKLLRAPPSYPHVERAVLFLLEDPDWGGWVVRRKLLDRLVEDGEGTESEVRRTIRLMVSERKLDAKVETTPAGAYVRMVALPRAHVWDAPPRLSADERRSRWERADRELERYCLGGPAVSDAPGGSGKTPLVVGDSVDLAGEALARVGPLNRRVLERAYGTGNGGASPDLVAAFGEVLSRLAPLTAAAEDLRRELVEKRAAEIEARYAEAGIAERLRQAGIDRTDAPSAREVANRATSAEEAVARLFERTAGKKGAGKGRRDAFVARARREAEGLLANAAAAYRVARGF